MGGFTGVAVVKSPPANAGDPRDMGSIPGWRRFPGVGDGNPLQYACLENFMGRGAWQVKVHEAAELDMTWQLNYHHPSLLAPCNKHCTFFSHNLMSVNWPYCMWTSRCKFGLVIPSQFFNEWKGFVLQNLITKQWENLFGPPWVRCLPVGKSLWWRKKDLQEYESPLKQKVKGKTKVAPLKKECIQNDLKRSQRSYKI